MKSLLSFKSLLLLTALAIYSCENDVEPSPIEEKYHQVKIGFCGELDVTQTPLTKTSQTKDWYYFQVYYKAANNSKDYYKKYAYGFFDNKEAMVINLKDGYSYKFEAGMIVDGSDKVEYFSLQNSGWASIANSFYISEDEGVRFLHEGYLYMKYPTSDQYNRPNVDRFYGVTEGYIPTENGGVSIEMKRISFAAKFVAKKFTEGKLELAIDNAGILHLDSSEGNEIQDMYSFNGTYAAFMNNDYTEDIAVNIIWVKPDGMRVPLASEIITFKRNTLTTIEFEVKESSVSNGFDISADEEWSNGQTITVGGGTNTDVNPS